MILPSLFSFSPCCPIPLSWRPSPTPPVPILSPGLSPVSVCLPVCVEVPSETEAVQGSPMKLRCISCMKREEVEATTVVEWFYRPEGGKDLLVRLTADSGPSLSGLHVVLLAPKSLQKDELTNTGSFASQRWQLLGRWLTALVYASLWEEGHLGSCEQSWLLVGAGREKNSI